MKSSALLVAACVFLLPQSAHAARRASCDDLRANLKSPTAKTREKAANELSNARCQDSVDALSALAADPDEHVRMAVVKALRELRDPGSVPALKRMLSDGLPEVRREAVNGLVEVYGDRARPDALSLFLGSFSDAIDLYRIPAYVRVAPGVIDGIAARLGDDDVKVRRAAAYALGVLRGDSAASRLAAALQDPDSDVRAESATSLEKIQAVKEGSALIPLVDDESSDVRTRALHALGTLQVREAGAAIRTAFDNNRRREWEPRILDALARVRDPAQREFFVSLVEDADPTRRRFGVEGLARLGGGNDLVVALKKDYQREKNSEVRLAFCFALVKAGDHAFVDSLVLALPDRGAGRRAKEYLVELGSPILPDLYPYLGDPSADVRAGLVDVFVEIGDPEAVPYLSKLTEDPNRDVADRATRAVERFKLLAGVRR